MKNEIEIAVDNEIDMINDYIGVPANATDASWGMAYIDENAEWEKLEKELAKNAIAALEALDWVKITA